MTKSLLLFSMAVAVAAHAQTAPKPTAKPATTHTATAAAKLPPGVLPVRGLMKTAFSLRYQDIKIGTGPEAEPNKMYKVLYTGWLASDGHKFDSTDDHPRAAVMDKDGKPVLGADGKPKQGPVEPIAFPQGFGRVIPGWDQGFYGMHIGGKRRIFIPWQLAYGARGRPGPDAAHPGIPAKADLIFDVELVDVADLPMPQGHPGMPGSMNGRPMPGMPPAKPAAPGQTTAPATNAPASSATPPPAAAPATPAQPATPPTTPPQPK